MAAVYRAVVAEVYLDVGDGVGFPAAVVDSAGHAMIQGCELAPRHILR